MLCKGSLTLLVLAKPTIKLIQIHNLLVCIIILFSSVNSISKEKIRLLTQKEKEEHMSDKFNAELRKWQVQFLSIIFPSCFV